MTERDDRLQRLLDLFREQIGDVDETLSSDDVMWEGHEGHYRGVGESAVRCVKTALLLADREPASIREVLDFGAGHGRVLRYLQKLLPKAAFTASDVDAKATAFCAKAFGATPVPCAPNPEAASFPSRYDLIWVGSVLTHMDADRWPGFLGCWSSLLRDDGILVFTTQGRSVIPRIKNGWQFLREFEQHVELIARYEREGFAYLDYDTPGYGVSMARPAWVLALLSTFPELEVLGYRERGWDNAQDVVTCRKHTYVPPLGPKLAEWGPRFEGEGQA